MSLWGAGMDLTGEARRFSLALLATLVLCGAASADDTIETVTVTAERRIEPVQEVPEQISAFSSNDIAAFRIRTAADLVGLAPGLTYQQETPGSDLLVIRGITTGGVQLSSAAGVYLDDVPLGTSSSFGLGAQALDIDSFDLNRIEVLNGPQGTFYGANTLGGALKYVTQRPDLDDMAEGGEAETSSTAHGGLNTGLRAMLNMPLLSGKAAIRVDALDIYQSGYIDDPLTGRHGLGDARTSGGRVSLQLQLAPDLSLRLSAFLQEIASNGLDAAFYDPVTHRPTGSPYDQFYPLEQPSYSALTLYAGTLNWTLDWAKLISITSYQYDYDRSLTDESATYDAILAPVFGAAADQPFGLPVATGTKKFAQEIRLVSDANARFEWLAGAFYTREVTREAVDLIAADNPNGTLFGATPFHSVLPSSYREFAFFADGTVHLANDFDVTAGIRYSQNHQFYQQISSGLFNNPADPASVTHLAAASGGNVVTYLFNPRYHLSDDVTLYSRIASGYRPGGPNFVLVPGHGSPTFKPDTLWNYELGVKAEPLENRVQITADIYDIEWSSIQLTVNNGGVNQLENAGNARVQGAETSIRYKLFSDVSLGGSAAYTDAHLTTPAPALDLSYKGARLPLSPRISFALTLNDRIPLDNGNALMLGLADRYVGSRTAGFSGSTTEPLFPLAAYNAIDVNLSLIPADGPVMEIFADNVTDARGQVSAITLTNQYNPAAPVPVALSRPRTIGLRLRFGSGIQ